MGTALRVTSWNVNGVAKLESFFGRPRSSVIAPDVLFLQETWAASESEQLVIRGYVAHHAPAVPSYGHNVCGVSSYFRLDTFSGGVIQRKDSPLPWVLTVRWVRPDGTGITFINIYAAIYTAGVLQTDFDLLGEYIEDLRSSYGADSFVVAGDLNIDRFRRPSPRDAKERTMLTIVDNLLADGFQALPSQPVATFVDSGSTLDYALVSGDVFVRKWELEENMTCQHVPLSVDLLVPSPPVPLNMPTRKSNLKFTDSDVTRVRELLALCSSSNYGRSIESLYSSLESCFLCAGVSSPNSDNMRRDTPASWWRYVPQDSRELIKQLEDEAASIFDSWCANPSSVSVTEVVDYRRRATREGTRVRREADAAIQREMGQEFPDQSLCWKILRRIRNPVQDVVIDIGTLQSHFTKVFHRRDRPLFHVADPVDGWGTTKATEAHLDLPFTDDELVAALRALNGTAATGPELVPSRIIKEVFGDQASRIPLLCLMNACWCEGKIPRAWGESELFILYKGKGSRSLADNYRAIALSNDFRRVFERLVGARLSSWIRIHDATGRMQFGFKRGSGTLDAIFTLRTALLHATRVMERPAYAVFVDIRKAFPSTSRGKILETFRLNQVPSKITQSVAALLSGSSSRLRVNNRLTEPFNVTSGTPEGSINSPDIFNVVYAEIMKKIGVRELPEDLADLDPDAVYYIIFADDITFFGLNLRNLGTVVSHFKQECEPCDLEVNSGKTKWMVFVPAGCPPVEINAADWDFRIDDEVIEHVDEFPYLGFRLDTRLSDEAHVKLIRDRLFKAARAVGQIMRDMQCSSLLSLRRYFLTLVASQLYGAIFVSFDPLEYQQAVGVFFKTALGLADSFPASVAMSMLGLKPFQVFHQQQRMKFLMKLEAKSHSPAFTCLLHDRCVLFPLHVGLNALLGDTLVSIDVPRTLDYKLFFSQISRAIEDRALTDLRSNLLIASGRAFWTELAPLGLFHADLRTVISSLPFDQMRVCILFLSDTLRWSNRLKVRACELCKRPFTVEHFFSCERDFLSRRGWTVFMSLCVNGSWIDLIETVFVTLQKWALNTAVFSPDLQVTVLGFEPFFQPWAEFNPFRLNV